ncbi:37S ribosomal protein S11 [Beauveria brongniartii RCEF 3172]|uniref:37S ribosomal protein S11 n=1 Tax=Beauveria brongniartii RCEF 3172 TaxID=1081107 RepID=A0A162J7K1_9HYPO|nr:37S ribosomal protein S11 [Beauveria brongniartii RCEF 3172]
MRPLTRLAALRPLPRAGALPIHARWLSQTTARLEGRSSTESMLQSIYGGAPASQPQDALSNLSKSMVFDSFARRPAERGVMMGNAQPVKEDSYEPYHLHIYAHKHNTHVTFTLPNKNAVLSLACGNVGFKKSRRGTFDAAYSLAKYALERLVYMGYATKVNRVELSLRGFGQGRDATIKALMSPEGAFIRDKIVRVTDATRIKYAGTRSPPKRRL